MSKIHPEVQNIEALKKNWTLLKPLQVKSVLNASILAKDMIVHSCILLYYNTIFI